MAYSRETGAANEDVGMIEVLEKLANNAESV